VIYADASFLVALYVRNDNTEEALRVWRRVNEVPLPYNPIHRLEVRNGIRLMAFTREITPEQARRSLRDLDSDLSAGDLVHVPLVWTEVLRRAEMIGNVTFTYGVRALDLVHLAAALESNSSPFLTFDERQAKAGRHLGLGT
jgi:predicted nucleic acid-binding protein